MVAEPISVKTQAMISRALEQSWSENTSVCYNPDIAPVSYGQCTPTAMVIFEMFGGEILRTGVQKRDGTSIRHFYNRIAGQRYDFTADQFKISGYWCDVIYEDIRSSVDEAATEMLSGQMEYMRSAFTESWQKMISSDNC